MRVRATATGSHESNAIGQVELECTPAGLAVGMFGVGAYSEGYATGALTMGTRFTVPYGQITSARARADHLQLEFDAPGLPHKRLTLSRFVAGPGVPPLELRRRRMILQFAALSVGAIACTAAAVVSPSTPSARLAIGALLYGALAGTIVLVLGYALHHSLFVRPPFEEQTRSAFISDLTRYYPHLVLADQPKPRPEEAFTPTFGGFLPRTAMTVGLTLAATILTALVVGQRMVLGESPARRTAQSRPTIDEESLPASREQRVPAPTQAPPTTPTSGLTGGPDTDMTSPSDGNGEVSIERRCMCDRPASQLWTEAIPRLSGLLIEERAIQLKSYVKTRLELAVINNGDSDVEEITLHVQFFENRGGKRVPTKERPLYFEGPLHPGEAIKWTTEARGTDFHVAIPDMGSLGQDGSGAAPKDAFFELLSANHRPVRLHAARLLSYLGDPRARDAALKLKDAMRAAEAPYLRRILAATGEIRVCDVQAAEESVGACLYNASDAALAGLGFELSLLSGRPDVDHPLSDPPSLLAAHKWKVGNELPAQSGVYLRVPLPSDLRGSKTSALEANADLFDLLD